MTAALGVALTPRKIALIALFAVLALVLAFQTPPAGAPKAMVGFAIVAFTVALWATSVIPALHSGAIFFALALATSVAPTIPLLSGFWSNAAALPSAPVSAATSRAESWAALPPTRA